MIVKLLILLISAIAWVATLWLVIAPDFAKWTNLGVIVLHALPPLLPWTLWIVWRRHVQRKKALEAQTREANAQAERTAAREAAQKKHEEELRQRRFACDCKALAIASLNVGSEVPLLDADTSNVDILTHRPDAAEESSSNSILDQLSPAMTEALTSLYTACGASVAFPIYVMPPAEVSGEEVVARVRAIHANLVDTMQPKIKSESGALSVLFLPTSDCTSNSLISLFETTPDLPGAVVLAFDSPHYRVALHDDEIDDDLDSEQLKKRQYMGKPNEAVTALLLTNTELPSMLTAVSGMTGEKNEQDSMTPFWEKTMQASGNLAMLARASSVLREELAQLPTLGRLHKAVFRQPTQPRSGVLDMTRLLQGALERAQVNAGLINPPFVFEDAPQDQSNKAPEEEATNRCSHVIHNAGGVDVAGSRLAALSSALYYFDIDLNLVDVATATNIVTRIGDMGRASGVSLLALSVAHAAQQSGPVLCAEFSEGEGIATSFVMPALA